MNIRAELSPHQTQIMQWVAEENIPARDLFARERSLGNNFRLTGAMTEIAIAMSRGNVTYGTSKLHAVALWGFSAERTPTTDQSSAAFVKHFHHQLPQFALLLSHASRREAAAEEARISRYFRTTLPRSLQAGNIQSLTHATYLATYAHVCPPPRLLPEAITREMALLESGEQQMVLTDVYDGQETLSDEVLQKLWLSSPRGLPALFLQLGAEYTEQLTANLREMARHPAVVRPHERPIATLVSEGYTDQQIAWRLELAGPDIAAAAVQSLVRANRVANSAQLAMKIRLGGINS